MVGLSRRRSSRALFIAGVFRLAGDTDFDGERVRRRYAERPDVFTNSYRELLEKAASDLQIDREKSGKQA